MILIHEQQIVNVDGDGGEKEGVLALHNPARPHDQARTKFSTPSENDPSRLVTINIKNQANLWSTCFSRLLQEGGSKEHQDAFNQKASYKERLIL